VQVELDTDKLVDAIVTKLAPLLAGKAAAERSSETAEGLDEFCASVGVGRTKIKREIAEGRLRSVKLGKKVLIPAAEKARWLASLPASAIKQTPIKALPHTSCSKPRAIPAENGAKSR
jgi:excisionase family DNA binding protein